MNVLATSATTTITSLLNNTNQHQQQQQTTTTTTTTTMAMTPESDISITTNEEFNPIIREKASSLTLPDLQLQFLRKGSSNPFIMTTNNGKVLSF